MKTLLLLRHAKSDWGQSGIKDYDRPLNERGRKAAPAMGTELNRLGWVPDFVMISAAKRTVETWKLLAPHLQPPPRSEIREELYLATDKTIRTLTQTLEPHIERAMLIAHNPGLATAARRFAAGPQDEAGASALKTLSTKFPTAALAVLQFDVDDWQDADWGRGALKLFLAPREVM